MPGAEPSPEARSAIERKFIWAATIVAVLLAALPFVIALIKTPAGASYLGFEFNTDDHMVYSAWMRQAMDGQFFFDNRFTTDPQPGLTVHLYFWILGLIAKVVGIPAASNLARLGFTALFVPLLYRLIKRVSPSVFVTRLAVALTVLGGGLGFAVWHNFGREIVRDGPGPLKAAMGGLLPVDVWQPEAFVFPSMLTNGLFMVSLCLMLVVFQSFLDARNGWKPVVWGGLGLGVLMNIHSYDVLTVAFAMGGFLVMQAAVKQLSTAWVLRGVAIAAFVIPAALWFVHVLQSDAVFQARAATPTYSANFRAVFFGYALMFVVALPGLMLRMTALKPRIGLGLVAGLIVTLLVGSGSAGPEYFLSPGVWAFVAVVALAALYLMAGEDPAFNLLLAWAVMGLIALYFPALFQRKLAAGLSVPWAILATLGFAEMLKKLDRGARNLASALVVILFGATSLFWIVRREMYLIRRDVSTTTVHSVYLREDARKIIDLLGQEKGRKVVLAMPGIPSPDVDEAGQRIPDEFGSPAIPDLNPILSGLSGVYSYAGHWSETPDYDQRRAETQTVFLAGTDEGKRAEILQRIKPDFIVAPSTETYGEGFADLTKLGEVVYSGNQFKLIRLPASGRP